MDGPTPQTVREALDSLLAELRAIPEAQRRFEEAGVWEEYLTDLRGAVSQIRAAAVGEIYETEQVSLADLADRIGTTRQRVHQLVIKSRKEDGS